MCCPCAISIQKTLSGSGILSWSPYFIYVHASGIFTIFHGQESIVIVLSFDYEKTHRQNLFRTLIVEGTSILPRRLSAFTSLHMCLFRPGGRVCYMGPGSCWGNLANAGGESNARCYQSLHVMLCKPALSATSVDHIHLAFTLDFSFTPSSLSCSQTSAIGRHNIIRDISNSRSIRRALHTRGNMYVHGEAPSVLHPGKNDRKTIIRHQLPRGPTHGHHVTLGLNTSTYSIRSHSVSVYCLVAFRGSHKEMSAKYNS